MKEEIKDIIFKNFTDFLASVDEYEYEEIIDMKKELDNCIKRIETSRLTPKKCSECGSIEILKMVYGEPDPEAYNNSPDIYFAGCICLIPCDEWICKKCHWQWGKNTEGSYCKDDFRD